MNPEIAVMPGIVAQDHLEQITDFRLLMSHEYPFLTNSTKENELAGLKPYLESSRSVFIVASLNEQIVGLATSIALNELDSPDMQFFIDAGYEPNEISHLDNLFLVPELRGKGFGRQIVSLLEIYAAMFAGINYLAFRHFERPTGESLQPIDTLHLQPIVERYGYKHLENNSEPTAKECAEHPSFWIRSVAKD